LSTAWDFDAAGGESIAGTYTDLGSNGAAITTNFSGGPMGFDNESSAPQSIGFNFVFNGTAYSTFVLNSNGCIKMGSAPLSSASIFYPTYNGNAGSVITAVNDIDLIYPYNHDLKAGSGAPEYRVYTSGTPGSRVCTIQFKNVADKLSPTQYTNMEFQVKLYEAGNVIEFVYGTWVAGTNTATGITAAVGIKGINAGESVNIARWSNIPWSTPMSPANNYYFQDGNYGSSGPQFNTQKTYLPDPGRTFRFTPSSSALRPAAVAMSATVAKMPERESFSVKVANPFREKIDVQIRSAEQQRIRLDLYDLNGRLLQHRQLDVPGGVTITSIPAGTLPAGIYLLKVKAGGDAKSIQLLRY
jgi:hypothetical protein